MGIGRRATRTCPASNLTTKLPLVIRLDGKAFHTYTRGLERPYAHNLMKGMDEVTKYLCQNVQNCVMAYTQSDEISLLCIDYQDHKTSAWFERNLQKMVSVTAGMASGQMTAYSPHLFGGEMRPAVFDARAFILPEREVNNYFVWRQQDWNRNSLSMLAQSLYSHKELQGKGRVEQHEMCFQKGHNWADLSSHIKDGRVVVKRTFLKQVEFEVPGLVGGPSGVIKRSEWHVPDTTPIFSSDPSFVNKFVEVGNG